MTDPGLTLADGMQKAGLTYPELWERYIAIGGAGAVDDLRDHVENSSCSDDHEHNVIAQALNDVFVERGQNHPVAYRHLHQIAGI